MNVEGRNEPRWLSDKEMFAWRTYIVGSAMLECRLNRELQEAHGLTFADYEILVRLSEQAGLQMRMTELAAEVASSKSRISHQVRRMESAGLLKRVECDSDGRGVFAELTRTGLALLRTAAPTHVEGVREHMVDLLSAEEQRVLGRVFDRIQGHLVETES